VSRLTVGIVDYGVGNHASVRHSLFELGFRCRVSDDPATLDACDILVLPGVGAFKPAMEALCARDLDQYLVAQAQRQRPLLGICLGMQLLADGSHEGGFTRGLGLIPGEVGPIASPQWHIGWNAIKIVQLDPLFAASDSRDFYFNHSYVYRGPVEHHLSYTTASEEFVSAIRRGRLIGVQFHPEKSQASGRELLRSVINGLCNA
jgi:glutamine amidotransferase